jgi:PAS domain S-box-containing protein
VPPDGPTEIAELAVHFNHMGITLSRHTSSLEEQKERYQQYIGATSHLLWTTDANGAVVTDLPTWRAYTGQGETDVRGVGWLDAVHAEEREAVRAAWAAAVRDRTLFESECRLRGQEGGYRHFSCRAVPIVRPDGTVSEWIGTCTDVTEKKQQAELQRAKEAAEASSRAKSEFLAKMSHELRTPLNAIIGMSRMLATQRFGSLNAKQADYLKDVVQAGEHLLNLINDILDIAKVESGRMDLHAEPFGLGQDVSTLLATLRPLAEEKKLALRFEPPQPDGDLATDRGRFRQVLYNLLSNAIKFTPIGGSVTVVCQWVAGPAANAAVVSAGEAAAVRVEVIDTGVGIAPEDQALIWDEFRQARLPSGAGGQGTGLGLALTRKLVGLLGGAVWLESAVGRGSTFTFVLPRELPQAPPPPADVQAGDGGKPLVLVIEDYPPTRKLLLDWLAEDGMATGWAGDGEAGLDMARRLRPRLIILDLMLPGLDGWQVLTELKSHPETASIPVVIVSVDESRLPSGYLDVQEYFVKPLERDSFLRRLRESHPDLFNREQPVTALVVDDDPAARKLLGDLLRAEQIDVVEATEGAEALRLLDARRPDFILVDLLMPGMDGFDVVDAVRGRPDLKDLPILVVSSKELTAEDRKRLNGNVQAFVAKRELTPEDLHRRLRGLGLSAGADADAPSGR